MTPPPTPAADNRLLDLLFREYPPLAPVAGRATPPEVPGLLLGAEHPTTLFAEAVFAERPLQTTWRVGFGRDGRRALGLGWVPRRDAVASWPAALTMEPSGPGASPPPQLGKGQVGARLDLSVIDETVTTTWSTLYPASGSAPDFLHQYLWTTGGWALAAVYGPYSADHRAVAEALRRRPALDSRDVPTAVRCLLDCAGTASVVQSSAHASVIGLGVDMVAATAVATRLGGDHPAAAVLAALVEPLAHRTMDIEVVVHDSGELDVAAWGVA